MQVQVQANMPILRVWYDAMHQHRKNHGYIYMYLHLRQKLTTFRVNLFLTFSTVVFLGLNLPK